METVHHPDRDPVVSSTPASPRLPTAVVVILLVFDMLLMVFSVVMWQLGSETLAAMAGAGATALTADIVRRLLAVLAPPSGTPASPPAEPVSLALPPGPEPGTCERTV